MNKTLSLFGMVSVLLLSSAAFAQSDLSCTTVIKEQALKIAAGDGFENCQVGSPKLSPQALGSKQLSQTGSIGLTCLKNVSQLSVVSEPESYVFSLVPGDCSTVAVYDNEMHDGDL
jgi:hypothetical protein